MSRSSSVLGKLLDEELFPLPQSDAKLLATREIIEDGVQGVGDQFRAGAETYDERYLQIDGKIDAIKQAFAAIGTQPAQARTALDIGCGSGNATFALLQMMPDAHVLATDLSPEMVTLLAARAELTGMRDRITPFVANASNLKLKPDAFDVIVGSSMLHHLVDPAAFLDSVLRSVAPGGVCIFTEPFQSGHLVLRQLLAQLVQLADVKGGLEPRHLQFFKDYIFTIDTMFRTDRDNPVFEQLDDKWMFPRDIFSEAAQRAGMRHSIFGRHASDQIYLHRVKELIRLGLGESIDLPEWMQASIGEIDRLISGSLGQELLLEGCIVFARRASHASAGAKKLSPVTVATRLGDMQVPSTETDVIGRFLHRNGEWAWDEVGFLASVLADDARVLDVGAFVGTFGLGLAARKPLASVCFVEANRAVVPMLRANVAANAAVAATVVDALVTGAPGDTPIGRAASDNLGSASFAVGAVGDLVVDGSVSQLTLGDLRAQHGPFDLIKLDVEGLELEIIEADRDYLRQGETALWVECNDNAQSLELAAVLLSWELPTSYFAFPSHNPDNRNGNTQSIFPMAYEAGLLVAPRLKPKLTNELRRHGCILKDIASVEDLKHAMWRTPRWGLPEWEDASRVEVAALAGHAMRGDAYARYLEPGWEPGEPMASRAKRAEDALAAQYRAPGERQAEIARLESTQMLNETTIAGLEAMRDALEAERDVVRADLEARLTAADGHLAERHAEIETLKAQIAQQVANQTALEQSEAALRSLYEAEREVATRTAELMQFSEQFLSYQRGELIRTRTQVEATEAELARVSAKSLDLSASLGALRERIEQLVTSVDASERRAVLAEQASESAEARARASEATAERARADAAVAGTEAEKANDRLSQFRAVKVASVPVGLYTRWAGGLKQR